MTVSSGSRASSSRPSSPVPAPRSHTVIPRRSRGKAPSRNVSVEGRNSPSAYANVYPPGQSRSQCSMVLPSPVFSPIVIYFFTGRKAIPAPGTVNRHEK